MAVHRMESATLGRPFTLGMLYNARKDELIPGLTLWDATTLEEHTVDNPNPGSKFNVSTSDTIESKSSLLDLEASLKASFLSGAVEIGGSAKYLNDKKKFKNQSRVTCQYNATTNFKQLSMKGLETLDTQQIDVIKNSFATHVVTGILYGANAFFVFDSDKLEVSSIRQAQFGMEAAVKKIPKVGVGAKVEFQLSDEEKALTEKFSCKFYGDFLLESNPTTFEEAIQTFGQLPKLLGENGQKSVPLKVWLMPLKTLHPEAAEMNGISLGLVGKAQDALEDLREIRMRCNDCLEDEVGENFPQIREELSTFQKRCGIYESYLQQSMAEKLPSIREGKEDESALQQLFEDRNKSPFSSENLTKWMDDKEREINVIRSCVDTMEGTKIVPNQNELYKEVLSPGVQNALCFVFTSLETADPYLDAMTKYLDSPKLKPLPSSAVLCQEGSEESWSQVWYTSNEVFKNMREKAKAVSELAKAQQNNNRFLFLIAAIANEKYTGATIYQYNEGILTTEDASISDLHPDLPPLEEITDRSVLMQYTCDLSLDPDTANNKLTLSEGDDKATCGEKEQPYPDHPERFDKCPQVLCKEGLTGRHYWEVEWSAGSGSVCVAVAYKGIDRKGDKISDKTKFGRNSKSWSLGQNAKKLEVHHKRSRWSGSVSSGCSKVGVYLDWPAGTLSFYRVCAKTLTHLYTFHTQFAEPVYPGFGIYETSNYAFLSPIK